MTAVEFNRLARGREAHHTHGWIVSMLCHVFGIGGVLLFMADIEPPVLPNTFQWEVAVVEAPSAVESAPAPPTPTPVPQRQVERSIDSRPRVETVEAVPQTVRDAVTPVETAQQTIRDTATPVETVPVEAGIERSVVQTIESPRVVTQAVTTDHASVVEDATSNPITHAAMEREEAVATQAIVAYASKVSQAEPMERKSPRSDPQSSEIEHRVVQHRRVMVRQTQADYGWLRDALWGRIHELKRYPSQAKENHWEGKVVVQVVIRADGTIVDLEVAESSGRTILDQEALAVMRKASPLTLKHPLGKPSITLLIPISYKLDG